MNDAHRRAAEQHELAARAHRTAAEHNERGMTQGDAGIRNERWSTRITLTNWPRKPTPSRARS
jgi:hypothetical protein